MARSRRAFLRLLPAAATLSVAGCVDGDDDRRLGHYVDVLNYTDEPLTLSVSVRDGDGETLFEQTYDIEGEHGDETNRPFAGDPATVVVTPADGERRRLDWPTPNCEERNVASAGGVNVYATRDGIEVRGECDTVYLDER